MRKTFWTVAALTCAGYLLAPEVRADDYDCQITGGDRIYELSLDDSSVSLHINGVEFDAYGSYDEDAGIGDFYFEKSLPIGMYELAKPELQFRMDQFGDGSLSGTLTSSDKPPSVLQIGCGSNNNGN